VLLNLLLCRISDETLMPHKQEIADKGQSVSPERKLQDKKRFPPAIALSSNL
jgi:hypothetical protein